MNARKSSKLVLVANGQRSNHNHRRVEHKREEQHSDDADEQRDAVRQFESLKRTRLKVLKDGCDSYQRVADRPNAKPVLSAKILRSSISHQHNNQTKHVTQNSYTLASAITPVHKRSNYGQEFRALTMFNGVRLSRKPALIRAMTLGACETRASRATFVALVCLLSYALTISLQPVRIAEGSLIIGDSAIEIQEVNDDRPPPTTPQVQSVNLQQNAAPPLQSVAARQPSQQSLKSSSPSVSPHSSNGDSDSVRPAQHVKQKESVPVSSSQSSASQTSSASSSSAASGPRRPSGPSAPAAPLKPITGGSRDDDTSDKSNDLSSVQPAPSRPHEDEHDSGGGHEVDDTSKTIAGKVVDFELTPAGGHNKAKIKKKKKKKVKKKEKKEESMFKKWKKKKKMEKKAMEKKEKHGEKKKKSEGKKKKKKWGHEEHGQKKKGNFKKKKWGKKVKKGHGVKKGKKGKKFLKDKGHKATGFKTVYHKEEWGKSAKWHDIKREKKWDEKSKKWKKKWKKEKGKKYKGEHMKKFEKKKKSGKKYKKEKKEKFKKFKKEEFKKGKKMKKEEKAKKKEGGVKKEMKEMKKKKKKEKKKKKG